MNVKKKGELLFPLLVLAVALFFVSISLSYDWNARLIPLGVGLATCVLIVSILINEIRPGTFLEKLDFDLTEAYRSRKQSFEALEKAPERKFFGLLCWLAGFFLLIFFFGFNIGLFLFAFAFLKTEAKHGWARSILTAAIIWCSIYAIFELAMGFSLFKGWLFGEMLPHL